MKQGNTYDEMLRILASKQEEMIRLEAERLETEKYEITIKK
jgi:hypothetical protein